MKVGLVYSIMTRSLVGLFKGDNDELQASGEDAKDDALVRDDRGECDSGYWWGEWWRHKTGPRGHGHHSGS